MPARTAGINLLPKTEFESSFWGRFLRWAITTGRYILILVELVVILAFLSRFKLDKDLADLSESITGKKAVLDASFTTEQNFRTTQARIEAAGTLLSAQMGVEKTVNLMATYIPLEVNLTNLVIETNQVTVGGQTLTQSGLATFLSRMTADRGNWKSIALTNVSAAPNKPIEFTLTATKR